MIFGEGFELASAGERPDLKYKIFIDGTAKVDHSAIQAALHEAILGCTLLNPSKIPSSDGLQFELHLRQPEEPRTSTGIALPIVMMNIKKGTIKFHQPWILDMHVCYAVGEVTRSSRMIGREHICTPLNWSRLLSIPFDGTRFSDLKPRPSRS